jgi:ankyrin repeat protein
LDATTTDGDTALHIAACFSKSDAVNRLLAAKARTAIRNKAGQTALDVARKEGHISVIALLEAAEKQAARKYKGCLFCPPLTRRGPSEARL